MRIRTLFSLLLLVGLFTAAPPACTWLKEHAARPAPAPAEDLAANATAEEEAATARAIAEAEAAMDNATVEREAPPELRAPLESDLDEPNPPGTRRKYGPREKSKPVGKSSEECYNLSRSKKGRCEPQCIPYVRCRTGITSCRLGHENNSLTWFACEKRHGNTSTKPAAGVAMILQSNPQRNMPTGHTLVVEKATPQGRDAWLLVVSHANWDTRCSLETDAKVLYNRATMRATFLSGKWKEWATNLVVLGFVVQ